MKRSQQVVFSAMVLPLLVGCSSLMTRGMGPVEVYPGVRNSVGIINEEDTSGEVKALMVLDLPLSAALDTALSPIDFTWWLFTRDLDE